MKVPIDIIGHTDSSLFLLGKKSDSLGVKDFYVSKHSVGKNSVKFDTCLNFQKLFNGKFNPDNFRYRTFQCKNKIVILFDVIISEKKTLIGKWIDYNGKVSEAVVVDKIDMKDDNLSECNYKMELTDKGDIFISVRRTYKSGYQRDRCKLVDENFSKLWEYDFPKINSWKEVNIISDIDKNSNLIYFIANERNVMIEKDPNNRDTIVDKKIGRLDYKLKFRRDSLEVISVNPTTSVVKLNKVYYPFFDFPSIRAISSSEILLYDEVNIDDENFILPAKKGIYYKRIDNINNKVLLDTLFVFDDKVQHGLTYWLPERTNRPTNKIFVLTYEKIIDGKLYSVFEHLANDIGSLEIFTSCFNITDNKMEWSNFIPRKIRSYPGFHNSFVLDYSNKSFNISFYERKENFSFRKDKYNFDRYKLVKNVVKSNFVTYKISNSGEISKTITDKDSENFIFPWLLEGKNKIFFESRFFLPNGFLYSKK
ncbi:MAG: hypothetical protein ACK504_04015 [Bacteroidota bacterium]